MYKFENKNKIAMKNRANEEPGKVYSYVTAGIKGNYEYYTRSALKSLRSRIQTKRKNKKMSDVSNSILISSCKLNKNVDKTKEIVNDTDDSMVLSKEEIPPQQIFDVNSHQKYRFLSEMGKRTINGIAAGENLNAAKSNGRKSVKREERLHSRVTKVHPMSTEIKTRAMKKKRTKINKDFSYCISETHCDNPLIINRLHDGAPISQGDENNLSSVITPKGSGLNSKSFKLGKSINSSGNDVTSFTSKNEDSANKSMHTND